MNNKINKICPLLYAGWLSFKGESEQKDSTEIECLKSQCAWWMPLSLSNEEQGQCVIIKLAGALKDKA